jgi:hypothetical protein
LNDNFYIEIVNEIFDGYTRFDFNDQTVFLRHFSLKDQEFLNKSFDRHKNRAVGKGIQEEKDVLERLDRDGTWTKDDELKISEAESYIQNLEKTKSKLVLPSQKESHQKLIDEEKFKLLELKMQKKQLIGKTATEYANTRSNEDFLRNLLYSDAEFKKQHFSDDEFGELDDSELSSLMNSYYGIMNKFADENIQHAVLQDCFSLYLPHCEKPWDFFTKPLTRFSLYQLKIIAYGRMFLNIFQNVDKIPDSIRKDPKALIDFAESSRNKEKLSNAAKDNSATALFGAKKEDLEFVDPEAKKMSLSELLKKNGGQLNMEQMMEVMGQKV